MNTDEEYAPVQKNGYPDTDHKPIAESELHRDLLCSLIETLKHHFRGEPRTYVSGALLVYYQPRPPVYVRPVPVPYPRYGYPAWHHHYEHERGRHDQDRWEGRGWRRD